MIITGRHIRYGVRTSQVWLARPDFGFHSVPRGVPPPPEDECRGHLWHSDLILATGKVGRPLCVHKLTDFRLKFFKLLRCFALRHIHLALLAT